MEIMTYQEKYKDMMDTYKQFADDDDDDAEDEKRNNILIPSKETKNRRKPVHAL